jgi:hypothetical protein
MLRNIMAFNRIAGEAVEQGVQADELFGLDVLGEVARARYIPESDIAELDGIASRIESQVRALVQKRGGAEEAAS